MLTKSIDMALNIVTFSQNGDFSMPSTSLGRYDILLYDDRYMSYKYLIDAWSSVDITNIIIRNVAQWERSCYQS